MPEVIDICTVSDLAPGERKLVEWEDLEIGVFNCNGEILAIEDRCSHDNGTLAEGDFDPATLVSNRFELEWPPKSGRKASLPEVDRAQWFSPAEARQKILPAQRELISRLVDAIRA